MKEVRVVENAVAGIHIPITFPRIPAVGEYIVVRDIEYVVDEVHFCFDASDQHESTWIAVTKSKRTK